jgi:hypothetical protein
MYNFKLFSSFPLLNDKNSAFIIFVKFKINSYLCTTLARSDAARLYLTRSFYLSPNTFGIVRSYSLLWAGNAFCALSLALVNTIYVIYSSVSPSSDFSDRFV